MFDLYLAGFYERFFYLKVSRSRQEFLNSYVVVQVEVGFLGLVFGRRVVFLCSCVRFQVQLAVFLVYVGGLGGSCVVGFGGFLGLFTDFSVVGGGRIVVVVVSWIFQGLRGICFVLWFELFCLNFRCFSLVFQWTLVLNFFCICVGLF